MRSQTDPKNPPKSSKILKSPPQGALRQGSGCNLRKHIKKTWFCDTLEPWKLEYCTRGVSIFTIPTEPEKGLKNTSKSLPFGSLFVTFGIQNRSENHLVSKRRKSGPRMPKCLDLGPADLHFALKTNIKTTFSKNQLVRSERAFRHQKSPKVLPNGSKIEHTSN